MITPANSDKTFDFRCLSNDEKPLKFNDVPIKNGSTLLEMDTTDIYIFDELNQTWRKLA